MDINMPDLKGIEATPRSSRRDGTSTLCHDDARRRRSVFAALRAGARGYQLKAQPKPRRRTRRQQHVAVLPFRVASPRQTSSPRLACFAAARFAVRRSLSVFCAGFFPSFLGFCEPFIASFLVAEFDLARRQDAKASVGREFNLEDRRRPRKAYAHAEYRTDPTHMSLSGRRSRPASALVARLGFLVGRAPPFRRDSARSHDSPRPRDALGVGSMHGSEVETTEGQRARSASSSSWRRPDEGVQAEVVPLLQGQGTRGRLQERRSAPAGTPPTEGRSGRVG